MSTFRRRMMIPTSKPYDAEVEYLQSDSSAYIDTQIQGADDLEISATFSYSQHVNYGAVYGNYISDNHDACRCILSNTPNSIIVNPNTICNGPGNSTFSLAKSTQCAFNASRGEISVNGIGHTPQKTQGIANNENIAIFNRSLSNPTTRDIGLRIYSFSIKKNGVLIRHFIPVRVEGVGFMYDKVTNLLFENVGSGQFEIGEDIANDLPLSYQKLEYVQNQNGNVAINTLLKVSNLEYSIETTFEIDKLSTYNEVYSDYTSEESTKTRIYIPLSAEYFTVNNYNVKGMAVYKDIKIGEKYSILSTYDTLIINGETHIIPEDNKTQSGVNNVNLTLFGRNKYAVPFFGKIYSFKVRNKGIDIADLIPCINIDSGIVGFYDVVRRLFFGDSNLTGG